LQRSGFSAKLNFCAPKSASSQSRKTDIAQIQKKLENHNKNIELVFSYLYELTEKKEEVKPRTKIGYKK